MNGSIDDPSREMNMDSSTTNILKDMQSASSKFMKYAQDIADLEQKTIGT